MTQQPLPPHCLDRRPALQPAPRGGARHIRLAGSAAASVPQQHTKPSTCHPPAPRRVIRHIQATWQSRAAHQCAAPRCLVLLAARRIAQPREPRAGGGQAVDGRVQQLGEEGGEAELIRQVAPAGQGAGVTGASGTAAPGLD